MINTHTSRLFVSIAALISTGCFGGTHRLTCSAYEQSSIVINKDKLPDILPGKNLVLVYDEFTEPRQFIIAKTCQGYFRTLYVELSNVPVGQTVTLDSNCNKAIYLRHSITYFEKDILDVSGHLEVNMLKGERIVAYLDIKIILDNKEVDKIVGSYEFVKHLVPSIGK